MSTATTAPCTPARTATTPTRALIVTDDFAASLMFTVPEGEMDNYDAGYILSLVELA